MLTLIPENGRGLSFYKGGWKMRDRKKQRELRKLRKEEKLDFRDGSGVLDPTPYYAVQKIIRQERKTAAAARKEAIA